VGTYEGDSVGDWVAEAVGLSVVAEREVVQVGDAEGGDGVGGLGVGLEDEDSVPVGVLVCVTRERVGVSVVQVNDTVGVEERLEVPVRLPVRVRLTL